MAVDFAFIDSGTGGIPYMNLLRAECPDAQCIYLADTAHFPYGTKTVNEIISCAKETVEKLISLFAPHTIIIACNTISVTALTELRNTFPNTLFVGTVPAIKQAAAVTKNHIIGLLATDRTISDPYTDNLITTFARKCTVLKRADAKLVNFIEHQYFNSSEQERIAAIKPAVDFFISGGADKIILGCTHFIHAATEIQTAAGNMIQIIDSRDGVIRQALKISGREPSPHAKIVASKFYISGYANIEETNYYQELSNKFNLIWAGSI